jgi:Zn-dependent protease with chaperone function
VFAAIPLLVVIGLGPSRHELLPPLVTWFLFGAAAWAGVVQSRIHWHRRINPAIWSLTPRPYRAAWIANLATSGALFLCTYLLFLLVGFAGKAAAPLIIAGGIIAVGAYLSWGSMGLLRWAEIITPASDRFCSIVSRIAAQMNVQPRSVDELALPMANAFAFIASRRIGATTAILEVLSDEELASVCAHELGHLSEPRWVRATRLVYNFVIGGWLALPAMMRALVSRLEDVIPQLVFLCGLLVSSSFLIFYLRLMRRMELRADGLGRQFEPAPGTYARALEKIHATNLVPLVIASKRLAHPDLYDRMVAAGAPPDYQRPSAPPSLPFYLGLLSTIVASIVATAGLAWVARALAVW